MSLQPIKTVVKYAGAWGLVAGFVALLTIIFSFLGALFCAALGGMMMGATRAGARLSIFFSLLCPAVLLGVMRSQQTELAPRQIRVLALICLGVFWAIYFLSAAVMAQEQKGSDPKLQPAPAIRLVAEAPSACATDLDLRASLNRAAALAVLWPEALEGQWCCEECSRDGRAQKRVLQIKDGALLLSTFDAQGNVCSCARGRLDWDGRLTPGTLALSVMAEESFPSPAI